MTTLLVIEDDDNNLTLISRLLELEDFEVRSACTGAEGVDMALELRPEAILLDIGRKRPKIRICFSAAVVPTLTRVIEHRSAACRGNKPAKH